MSAARRRPAEDPGDATVPGRPDEAARDNAKTPGRSGLPAREPLPRSDGDEAERATLELARKIVDLAADKKASDIVLLGVRELTTMADYFVMCSGSSERQLGAIADGIAEGLRGDGVRPIGKEGTPGAHWVLLDFGAVVVHIFAAPERDYYELEKLWSEAPTILRVL